MTSSLPDFASNNLGSDYGHTVADRVNQLFRELRENKVQPPPLAIATAYINPGGFVLLADELERAPRVRLLLGAEPEQDVVRAATDHDADRDHRIDRALEHHHDWMAAERDTMGFSRIPTEAGKRMVRWLRRLNEQGERRVEVRRYTGGFLHGKTYLVEDGVTKAAIAGSSNFTRAGLSINAELNLGTQGGTHAAEKVSAWFDSYWEQSEAYDLAGLYGRMWEPHSPWSVYLRMLWELYGTHLGDEDKNVRTRLNLTRFQADGVARMERLLDEHGGVLVADEVGLGKTYLAGEVIYHTANINRQRVLIVAPAALKISVWEPFLQRYDFSRWVTVYSYEEVRNKLDPSHAEHELFRKEIEDYALVVVDEAHNLRNPGTQRSSAADLVITAGTHPKKVVLLTATPVNNSLADLETLIKYFIRDDARFASLGIPSIRQYIKQAEATDPANLNPEHLFDLMDQVAVRRTRKFVKQHYKGERIPGPSGVMQPLAFPQPRVRRIDYELDNAGAQLIDAVVYALDSPGDIDGPHPWAERVEDPARLMMARYMSSAYTVDRDLEEYQIRNAGLLRSALLKRLESSPHALAKSLDRLVISHEAFLSALDQGYVLKGEALTEWGAADTDTLEEFLEAVDMDSFQAEPAVRYHVAELHADVVHDIDLLRRLKALAHQAASNADPKITQLVTELKRIASDARRNDNRGISHRDRRKVLIFSAFSDTILPVHAAVTAAIEAAPAGTPLSDYQARVPAPVMGAYASTHSRGDAGGVDQGGRAATLAGFAPKTAGPVGENGQPLASDRFDLIFTTDVLAEGVNLQQAGQMINYDLPWNPMRIVQRHGRIDRINSEHDFVHLGLFFPAEKLDALLALESRLNAKLALADAAVGAGEVLPGRGPGHEVNLADDHVTEEIEDLLNAGGSSASLSGEEYRRRLYDAFDIDTSFKEDVITLPYASGSGFQSEALSGNGYVFCLKIGNRDKPWFRFVRADENWSVVHDLEGKPLITNDTLLSLRIADPEKSATARWLPDQIYNKAFDAWQVARDGAYEEWTRLTDPNALTPEVPLAFRDASNLIVNHGGYLGADTQREVLRHLQAVPSVRVERRVRSVLNTESTNEARIAAVQEVLDDAGIVPPPITEPLPDVEPHEVRLVAWMAVEGKARGQNRS